uniref:NB-ARC domain-containing protein n=2 Tax=Oryza rufipogon TaxID=4529 RepID=A0A0E0QY97_ORYRU
MSLGNEKLLLCLAPIRLWSLRPSPVLFQLPSSDSWVRIFIGLRFSRYRMEAPPLAAPICASQGAMGSLLGKMEELLVAPDGSRLPKGVKDRMLLLGGDLGVVAAYLADLWELEDPPPTAKRWMREVRELSYDIEDYIDEFCAAPRPGRRANTMARFVCRIGRVNVARLPKRLKRHQQMGKMVSQFRIYVEEAIERHGRYGLDCCDHRRRYVSFGPMLPSRPYGEEDAQLVIDGRVSEFIERLANDEDQKLKVVSVVGSSGIGKTTLAKLLYNRIGGQFDCRAFVRISRKPDMKRVFREMFFQLQRKQPPDDYKELALIDSIREYLQDRRYLIIIDDLWAASIWDLINQAFPETCLLYLNMYPEGYKICKDDVVEKWVAEGFIDQIEGRDLEKVAGSYFDELIDRRFLQPSRLNYNNEVSTCTIHDEVRDLIAYKSVEENFVLVLDFYRKDVELSDKVRRLSVYFGDIKYAKIPTNIRTSEVRSLTFFGLCKCMPSLTEFKLLRVLNLQLSGHVGDELLDLSGISELFQLRYLKIACDIRTELPSQMRGLKYLETLQMDTTLTAVPWDIIFLPCLLHLHLRFDMNLIDLMGHMTPLSELGSSSSNSSPSGGIISNLNNVRDIHLTFCALPSKHLERNMEILGSLLGRLGNLKNLTLVSSSSQKKIAASGASEVTILWDNLAPPPLLQRFEWLLHSCIFYRVPKWIGELGNLCILKIAVRELVKNSVDILRGLPALMALSLNVHRASVENIFFDKVGFSVLKYFKYNCSVPWLKFEAGAMPNLRKLKLGFSALGDLYGTAPIRIGHLLGLKEISVKIHGASVDAESALTSAVSNHPSNPRINVQLVDKIFYGDRVTKEKDHGSEEEQNAIMSANFDEYHQTQDKESSDANKQVGSIVPLPREQEHGILEHDEYAPKDPDKYKQSDIRSVSSMYPWHLKFLGALSIHGGTRLATAPRKAEDAYISYAMKGNMQDSVHMPDSSCYLSMLVLPMALDMKSHLYESFEVTLARANTWLYASQASGVPIKLMSVQSDDLLTKISRVGDTTSATVNSGLLPDLSNATLEDYQGYNTEVVKAARLWYSSIGGEMPLEITPKVGDTKLGFAISRTEEGFIYISSVLQDDNDSETPSTRSGMHNLFNRAREASKLLVISRVSNEKVLPWMISSSGAIRCFDTLSISQKLSLSRYPLCSFQLHLLMWEKPIHPAERSIHRPKMPFFF